MDPTTSEPTQGESLDDLSSQFKWPEYVVFVLMLLVSAGIGVFYGCFGGKQKTTSEFLMASRSMSTFPMAMSLIASFMSAITLLGTPAEMYQYGTQYWVIAISYFFVMASAAYLYLPVFFKLQVTSAYEYLELRFAKPVRLLGCFTFTLQMSIYMAIVVYAPALALSQVTGINVWIATTGIFVVCIFYTALGGMKAVMWTDTFQVVVMFGSMLVVIIKGAIDIGGDSAVWEAASQGNRIEFFNWNMDPRERHTLWNLIIGGYFTWIAIYGVNQSQVQRYLTVPTIKMAQTAIWANFVGLTALLSICCYAGLVVYAKYHGCDPLLTKRIEASDQLFPLFVMEILGDVPGLPGLFVAGIFSGALSTVSSGLNSLAAIALEDVCKSIWTDMTEETATKFSKWLAVAFGIISFGLVFVAAQLGGVLQAALSIFGMVGGPLLGVFTLGMFFPWANAKGAFTGTITALTFMFWLGFGANINIQNKTLVIPKKEFSVEDCPVQQNVTAPSLGEFGGVLEFYRLSYMWYSMIACIVVLVVGLTVSFLTGPQDPRKLSPELISPPINAMMKKLFSKKFLKKIKWELGKDLKSKDESLKPVSISNGNNIGVDNLAFNKETGF
ncbi:unnamed protein product [Allacma fusca]|uniref:Sodium-coupled monocarboxylate transporter 1 n=1 Tax=Allacma fusca TaxID=39272 RepID=A0A8J2LP81_9HEXA|nr:unnamed protein product [Allacma fusca]